MSTQIINDSQRSELIGILMSDPALAAAEQERRGRLEQMARDNSFPLDAVDSHDLFPGDAHFVGDDAHEFVGLLDPSTPHDPVTDEFPVIDPQAVLGDDEAVADAVGDEELAADTASPPAPSRWQSLTGRINPRNPLLWIAAAAVIVTVGAVTLSGGGSGNSALTITQPSAASAAAPTGNASVDRYGPIRVASATGRCPTGSSNPMLAFDENMETAWVCVRAYGIDGQVLQIDLGGVYEISQIAIVPGWNKTNSDGSDEWQNHRTAALVTYQFNDVKRSQWQQDTKSARELVVTKTTGADGSPILASHVTITINKTASTTGGQHSGDSETATDFAVSEIQIVGRVADK